MALPVKVFALQIASPIVVATRNAWPKAGVPMIVIVQVATLTIALFAPRTWGLTCLRVLAPASVVVALCSAFGADSGPAVMAVAGSMVTAAFACCGPVAQAAANAATAAQ